MTSLMSQYTSSDVDREKAGSFYFLIFLNAFTVAYSINIYCTCAVD